MSKFNYVTGYLPYVIDEEVHRKKTKQRVIFSLTALATGMIAFSFLGNDTSAQNNQADTESEYIFTDATAKPVNDVNSVKLTAVVNTGNNPAMTDISLKQAVVTKAPVSKTAGIQPDRSKATLESTQVLKEAYDKEVENILSKAFSK